MSSNKKSALHYAWVVLISTIVMNFFYSIVFSSFGVYAASVLEANPGISRTAYSFIPTLHSLFSTVFLLSYGKIVQKVSFRGVILGGGLSIALGYFIYSFASNIFTFYIGAFFVGLFPAFCSSTTTGSLINRWFGKLNSTLLSISMAIGGFGGTIGSNLVGKWLSEIGYKASFRNMAIMIAVVVVILFFFVRNSPEEKNTVMLWASEEQKKITKQEDRPGYTLKQAMKTYNFWAIAVFFVLYSAAFYAAYANVTLYMADLGWDSTLYGAIFGIVSVANVIAMVPGGYAADKVGSRITVLILCVLYAVVCVILGFTTPTVPMMYLVTALIGVCWLFAKVLHTPLALLFGSRDSASIIAILTAAITIGASIGIPAANIIYDMTGSYAGLFKVLLFVLVIGLVLAFTAIKPIPGADKVGGPDSL